MTEYAVYQITCGHRSSEAEFEVKLADLLSEQRQRTGVSVTVNSLVHSVCIYTKRDGSPVIEPCTQIIVSINPNHNPSDGVPAHREAKPFVVELAEKLREAYDQYVVPYSAISPADSVGAAKKKE